MLEWKWDFEIVAVRLLLSVGCPVVFVVVVVTIMNVWSLMFGQSLALSVLS